MLQHFGVLTEAGAGRLGRPHLARCVVAYTEGPHAEGALYTREIFFRRERIGGILRLGDNGVEPLAATEVPQEDRELETMARLVRSALDAALLSNYSVVVHDGMVAIGDASTPDLVTLSRTSVPRGSLAGPVSEVPAWEIQVTGWDDGGRAYPSGPDVVTYRVEETWAAAAEQAVLWIHRQSIGAAFSLLADDEPGGAASVGAVQASPSLRPGPVPITLRGWRGSPEPVVVQGVFHPGRMVRGVRVDVLEVPAGGGEGDLPNYIELVRDASALEIFVYQQLYSRGGVNWVAVGDERASAILANGMATFAVAGALGELHYKKPINLGEVYRSPQCMEVARSALALMEACPALFPGLFPVE
jgi:hypothetical protein